MAAKCGLGIELNLNKVPCREKNMSPYEMMLSESQERMLIILNTGKEKKAKQIFDKWNLDFSIIGKTTDSKKLMLFFNNENVANIDINLLSDNAPLYDRKWKKTLIPKKQ
jgi:phosphoribosylformylglycinamidine synthase subunit PurL